MPFHHNRSWMAIGFVAIVLASPTLGQELVESQPFAQADLSTYGTPHLEPHQGFFFTFDGLYWAMPAPQVARIGAAGFKDVGTSIQQVIDNPTVSPPDQHPVIRTFAETSTEDTSQLKTNFEAGQRIELGNITDNNGWIVSTFRWGPTNTEYNSSKANILFNDPVDPNTGHGLLFGTIGNGILTINGVTNAVAVDGNLPTVFDSILVHNKTDLWGVETSYLRRLLTCHNGATLEFTLGARYLEFNETFGVIGIGGVLGGTTGLPNGTTRWETIADNHIIGPQVGARYFKQQGRWIVSTEGRFMAGLNRQNIFQNGQFLLSATPGSVQAPFAWQGAEFSHRTTIDEFSPLAELRLDARYVLTRGIDFRVGWTGIWVDGIARPANMTEYAVPAMGIDATQNRQGVFVNGLTMGFDINR